MRVLCGFATGEVEGYPITKTAELASSVVPVLEALETRWREAGAIE
jgi:hypothetical protein